MKRARARPWAETTASRESIHSLVSAGSRSGNCRVKSSVISGGMVGPWRDRR